MKKRLSIILLAGFSLHASAAVNPSVLAEFKLAQSIGDPEAVVLKPCHEKKWGRCYLKTQYFTAKCWKQLTGPIICREPGA